MRLNGKLFPQKIDPKVYHLLFQDEIITDKINKDVQDRISAPAGDIAKGLYWNKPLERRVEKVYYLRNGVD